MAILCTVSNQEMIAEFREAFGLKPDRIRDWSLIEEEFDELSTEIYRIVNSASSELKELADLVYVCYQFAASNGYDLDQALRRVHASNMSKIGPEGQIERNRAGKVLKGPHYQPPNLEGCY
jgi:NTP pyrophosphatase (non-canonical NTP hydrolase)